MSLLKRISADFLAAYKNKDMERKDFLGLLKTTVTDKSKTPDDAYIVAKVKSMIKTHEKSMSEHNAPTLSELELVVLNEYLPTQLNEADLEGIVNEFIVSESLSGPKDMGRVMAHLKNTYGGQYDGKLASNVVKSSLSSLV